MKKRTRAKDLERLMATMGVPASVVDVVTRKLREVTHLPIGGRGPNAPKIGPAETAFVLIATASADVAAHSAHALASQNELHLPKGTPARYMRSFVDSVQLILGHPDRAAGVAELRLGRSHGLSQIIYRDGHVERFIAPQAAALLDGGENRLRSEGIIGGGALHSIALELARDTEGLNTTEPLKATV